MKKLLAIAICSLPLALAPTVYAQSNTTSDNAAAGGSSGSSSAAAPKTDMAGTSKMGATDASKTGTANMAATDSTATVDAKNAVSAKNDIIGVAVYNEKDEHVGDINDLLLTPNGKVAYYVVGVGGFLGLGEHSVALPYDTITKSGDKMSLKGYTKDELKDMPAFKPKSKKSAAPAAGARGTLGAPAAPGAAAKPGGTMK